jgi:hypothetical protein
METMTETVVTGKVEELTSEQVSAAIGMCGLLRNLFVDARRSIERGLSQGVDAKEFAAKYEQAVVNLEAVLTTTQKVVTKARIGSLPPPAEQVVASFTALMDDLLSLHQFLAGAVATAKMPHAPVDWKRVQEAKAAYERGETKVFQRSPRS